MVLGQKALTGRGGTRRGGSTDGAPCKVAGWAWGLGPRKAPLGARANRKWLLSCRLSLTRRRTPTSRSAAPLHSYPFMDKRGTATHARRQQAAARARRAKPGAEGAGKAERSECRAREDYGWGWAGGVTKPYHATHPTRDLPHPPQTPAAAQAPRPQAPHRITGLEAQMFRFQRGKARVYILRSAPCSATRRRPIWRGKENHDSDGWR